MADGDEQHVSSTTPLFSDELHHYQPEPEPGSGSGSGSEMDQAKQDFFSSDDIVDLVGGARDALERHKAEDSSLLDFTETSFAPPKEPVTLPEPEPVSAPGVKDPETEVENAIPDSTSSSFVPEFQFVAAEPEVVAPKAEPESTTIVPEPQAAPDSDALPAAEPRKAAPAPVKAAERPAVTEEAPAPASCLQRWKLNLDSRDVPSLSTAQTHPLMQFPTALGQKGDSPAPISPISPLHSPDSLEELSLTESPNQPPVSGSAAPLGSFSTEPPTAHSKDMLWESEEGDTGPSHKHWDSPLLATQDSPKVSMDSFSKDTAPISSSRYEPDLHSNQSDEDDDLMYEVKKNNNPFEGYSPLADSGYSHFGDSKSDSRASKMSESPTPDLVQYGQTGESQDSPPSFLDEAKTFETGKMAAESLMQSVNQFSSGLKDDDEDEEEDSALPPSLPDILKSSPLNPDKIDSGSSEGSPEEQSPILERRMMESPNPPINLSANNPFAFDAKVSLLKEMAEEMEEKAADKAKTDDDKSFGAFDLVKEAEETTPTKVKEEEPVKIEQRDWFSSHDSPKITEKFEPLDFQSKKTLAEDSDSESPTADSLSPVLEAMAKNPAIFQVETEKKDLKMEVEEAEVAEEVSEHEVSSEEFEFIERPPKGVIDEFLEALDTSKFASSKPPEIPMDDDLSFGQKDASPVSAPPPKVTPPPEVEEEAPSQTSYLLLTQASPQKIKAELEKLDIQKPPSHVPLTHSPVCKPDEVVAKTSVEGGKLFKMPNVNIRAVVDLLYWRDVKTTGVVFGAALLLLLSLTVCSIVSVSSYIGLALLSVTVCFRIYKGILQAIQKSDEGHPFKQYLDQDVSLSEDTVHKYSDVVLAKLNKIIVDLRRLFLVEDLVDSIKFAVLMWILTYVGALFNGLTLLILGLIGAFSCPIIYEKHQAQIDHYLALVNNQIKDIVGKIQAKVPGMKRKTE
ncbi:reticulon-4 isoform X3 [Anabas testudineus]|uniref:reticulon-4 isoform X3 n=1 Tax=Anabas testudineus TaxID=64144 RepID=UPI000E45BF61|nr:reticulon-4 isoform X3 [Anabas testudineus]